MPKRCRSPQRPYYLPLGVVIELPSPVHIPLGLLRDGIAGMIVTLLYRGARKLRLEVSVQAVGGAREGDSLVGGTVVGLWRVPKLLNDLSKFILDLPQVKVDQLSEVLGSYYP